MDPLVSVLMITYRHELYIKDALGGVLMQDFDSPMELIIADDCSPDRTENEIVDYLDGHPKKHIVKYTKHSFNKGINCNFLWALNECRGEYIALCEGDDFWTDRHKLQKQVDFLKTNLRYSACFHDCDVLYTENKIMRPNSSAANYFNTIDFNFELLCKNIVINTCTIVFRKDCLIIPITLNPFVIDRLIFQLLSLKGEIRFLKENMAVYRLHPGGITRIKLSNSQVLKIINRWHFLDEFTNFKFHKLIKFEKRKIKYSFDFQQNRKDLLKSLWIRMLYIDVVIYFLFKKILK
jgi:glycosyltransferase involved in cell wall biosynthesis